MTHFPRKIAHQNQYYIPEGLTEINTIFKDLKNVELVVTAISSFKFTDLASIKTGWITVYNGQP